MEINPNGIICGFDGNALRDKDAQNRLLDEHRAENPEEYEGLQVGDPLPLSAPKAPELKLGTVLLNSLLITVRGEMELGEVKSKKFAMALRIHEAVEANVAMELKVEEIVLLKAQIAKAYNTMIYGLTERILEGWARVGNEPSTEVDGLIEEIKESAAHDIE